jgi:hypothetical protein
MTPERSATRPPLSGPASVVASPSLHVGSAPQTAPAVGGCWRGEPVSPAELMGTLLGDADEPSNIDDPQEVLGQGSQPEPSLSASRP